MRPICSASGGGIAAPSDARRGSHQALQQSLDKKERRWPVHVCDYRSVNAVTKADRFPLPRIADLLDQLGSSRFFTTLDLALGFSQVNDKFCEKTAFITHCGLYIFHVMPFSLTNHPAIFQRLIQRVLEGVN